MEKPRLQAYSLYTSIAEKFEAIVSLGYANSRYKDFYDIYILINKYQFEEAILTEVVQRVFEHRGTTLDDIVAFEDGFTQDERRIKGWNGFSKKKSAIIQVDFLTVIDAIKVFIAPILNEVDLKKKYKRIWNPQFKKWI